MSASISSSYSKRFSKTFGVDGGVSEEICSLTLKHIAEVSSLQVIPTDPLNSQKVILIWSDVHRCLVNALRRIVHADMTSMRFEHLWTRDMTLFMENPSLSAEQIGLQLGLMPFNANPDDFLWEYEVYGDRARQSKDTWDVPYLPDYMLMNEAGHGLQSRPHMPRAAELFDEIPIQPHARAHLVFKLDVTCTFNHNTKRLEHDHVTTSDLVWKPLDETQRNMFPVGHVFFPPDIPILTLSEGQTIKVDMWATKGTGAEVAKWTPVENMFFREIPNITVTDILKPMPATSRVHVVHQHMHFQNRSDILRSIISSDGVTVPTSTTGAGGVSLLNAETARAPSSFLSAAALPLRQQSTMLSSSDVEDLYTKLQMSCRKKVFTISTNQTTIPFNDSN